jgi:hypothetical protein
VVILLVAPGAYGHPDPDPNGAAPPPPTGRTEGSRPEDPPRAPWGELLDNERAVVSLEAVRHRDASGRLLEGGRVGFGVWDEGACDFNVRSLYNAVVVSGGGQRVASVGLDGALLLAPVGPFRIMAPGVTLDIEHRSQEPHRGLGIGIGVGAEVALWLGRHLKVAAGARRRWVLPSGTQNQVSLALRWTPQYLFGIGTRAGPDEAARSSASNSGIGRRATGELE